MSVVDVWLLATPQVDGLRDGVALGLRDAAAQHDERGPQTGLGEPWCVRSISGL